jgi:DNA-binding response OmpR family regulator
MSLRKTILVVEDDADLRRMFRTALVIEGFDVKEAADGLDALRKLDEYPPDLIVLDLGLPIIDGFSVQADIASRANTRRLPVVVVTGSLVDLETLDVACVLRKPVDPDTLVATVRKCLARGPSEAH